LSERVDRTERLLNLVICLMATSGPVPRAEIQRQIPGYSSSASPSAFERMFERDKDELRSMGIPVETVADASGEVQGYRISRDSYALAPIDLTLDERAAIAVAAQVWSRASIAPVPGTALRKLQALDSGVEEWEPADVAGSVQVTATDAALLPMMSAIRQDRMVTFPYRTPTDAEARTRHVSPWGLRASSGRWFLVGFDQERDAVRTFRLSRITGAVAVSGHPRQHQPPPGFDIRAAEGSDEPDVSATIRVTHGRGASIRRRAVTLEAGVASDVLTVSARTKDALLSLVCGAGADATVLAPDELVDDVVSSLVRIRDAHRPSNIDAR
jgi:predicted DNA-binding transcriptional regulator YafY